MKVDRGFSTTALVIPTLNAEPHLGKLLKSLKAQEQPPGQILVIDSGSDDNTVELALSMGAGVKVIEPGTFDHGATRNLGAALTGGTYIIFMTQDAIPADDKTLGSLLAPLQQENVVVSYARQIPADNATLSEKYQRLSNYPPCSIMKSGDSIATMGIRAFQSSNVCAAYRRREFEDLGCFPQPAVCNEDMIFAARAIYAGYRVAYCAEAKVIHSHNLTAGHLFRRYFDISASLDNQPEIRAVGRAESKGFDFFQGQVRYFCEQGKTHLLPLVLCETGAKYLGYKAGASHGRIPRPLKKYLGLNRLYWSADRRGNLLSDTRQKKFKKLS